MKDRPLGLSALYLAAVSGGADSVAMLVALVGIREQGAALDLRCIHVEHGLRPDAESKGDADFVRSLCEKLHVPCRVVSIPPGKIAAVAKQRGLGIEAAARLYRRRAFFRDAAHLNAAWVLTAHTADDALETALMRILRGAGPSGLAAMPAARGRLLRPLLALSRRDVLDYLAEKNISWREDSTNADTVFLRNRIRHRLIPLLNESFPQWRGALTSLAETQSLAASFIESEAKQRVIWDRGLGTGDLGCLFTDSKNFFTQPAIVREEALFQGIDMLLAAMPAAYGPSSTVKRANIRRFSEGTINAADLGPLLLSRDSLEITISAVVKAPDPRSEYSFSLLIKAPGLYNLKGIAIDVRKSTADAPVSDGTFLALLPLVVRPPLKEDCGKGYAAVDRLGIAAFIDGNGLAQRRDDAALRTTTQVADDGGLCVVKITLNCGSMNV